MRHNSTRECATVAPVKKPGAQTEFSFGSGALPPVWSISELTARIKGVLEPSFPAVWVQGEVSNLRPAASGHLYFSLKDAGSSIAAACFGWGSRPASQRFELRDGMSVLCRGRVSVYGPRGSYQLTVEQIEPVGVGALQAAFEALKAKLQAEGLFSAARKRPLPAYPSRVAVITSPTGAAIQDMLNVLGRRAPHVRVTVVPALVQGEGAAAQLVAALRAVNQHGWGEVVVLARGGGSIEDLWAFNDEGLAREIAASRLPVISAVGHEIDFTIADFTADLRAATPSAAAELLSNDWHRARAQLAELRQRLDVAAVRAVEIRRQLLEQVRARLVGPQERLREAAQRLDELWLRLDRAIRLHWERRKAAWERVAVQLDALSPLRVLDRGYGIVHDATSGAVLRSAADVRPGRRLRLRFADGEAGVVGEGGADAPSDPSRRG